MRIPSLLGRASRVVCFWWLVLQESNREELIFTFGLLRSTRMFFKILLDKVASKHNREICHVFKI